MNDFLTRRLLLLKSVLLTLHVGCERELDRIQLIKLNKIIFAPILNSTALAAHAFSSRKLHNQTEYGMKQR